MLFLLFGMAGFFIFFIWLIIAAIIKKPKKIPTIGFILSTIVFVISVGISTSNDKSTSTGTEKNVIAGKSDNDEIKNSIDRNIVGLDKGNNYSIEIKEVESGRYSATVQLRAYSTTSSDACVNTAEHLIGGLINYQSKNFQKIQNLTLKFIDDSNNSLIFIIEANDTKLITNKDSIRNNIILKDGSGKNIYVKSEEELKKAKAEAEAKQKAEAEAKEKAEEEAKQKEINDFKVSCKTIPYKDLARNPKNYIGKNVLYTGKVIQVMLEYK